MITIVAEVVCICINDHSYQFKKGMSYTVRIMENGWYRVLNDEHKTWYNFYDNRPHSPEHPYATERTFMTVDFHRYFVTVRDNNLNQLV